MKFKKSYLLIISLISILLCISAVSASDNVDAQVLSDNSQSDLTATSNDDVDMQSASDKVESDVDAANEITNDKTTDKQKLSTEDNDKLRDAPEKINTTTESKDKTKELMYNKSVELDVSVKDNASKALTNLTKDHFNVIDNGTSVDFTYNNSIIKLTNNLNAGLHFLIIKFLGNETYNPSNTTVNVTIFANTIKTDKTTVNVYKHDGNVTLNITVQDYNGNNVTLKESDLKINVTDGNTTTPITGFTIIDGIIKFHVDNLNQTKVKIYYKEDDPSNYTKPLEVTLNPYVNAYLKPIDNEVEYKFGKFKFQLRDTDTDEILAGKSISVSYKGSSVTISNPFTSDDDGYIIIAPDDGLFYFAGSIPLNVGKYNLTFSNNAKDVVLNDTSGLTKEITVKKSKVIIEASDYSDDVGNSIKYSIKAKYENGEVAPSVQLNFAIKLSGGIVERNLTTNSSGDTYLTIKLDPGNYPLTISSRDSNFDADPVNRAVTVNKIAGILEASDRTIEYNSDSSVIFTLKSKKTGEVLPNVKVSFLLDSKEYKDYKTNSKGQIVFITPLNVGKHKVVISVIDPNYEADTITRYVTVKKATGKFTAKKLKTYYKSSKKFTIKLTNTKLNKAIYNGNVLIKIYINKNQYYKVLAKTNIDGLISFSIPYKPGKYRVVISSNDKGYSAKKITRQVIITKAPVKISPSKFKAKSGKKLKIKVSNKYTKKGVKGLKLKVKVKGKTYTIKSNKKGIAYLKIKQKPGKYKVVINTKSAYFTAKTTKTTIRVKK